MKKYFTKEATIGLVTIISIVILYFGINYLKGINLFMPTNYYYVKFNDITDLQLSSPVFVDGFKIGVVNKIEYDYEHPGNIMVLISLDKSMKIQQGSYAELSVGLTSGASLNIILNKYVTSYYSPGDILEGRKKEGMMEIISNDVFPQVQELLPKMDSILIGLQQIVNHPALIQSLDHIERTTSNLAGASAGLNSMVNKDIPYIVRDFRQISSDFTTVSGNLKALDLQKTLNNIDLAMENVGKLTLQMNSKDNTLGLLLNDRKLYDNLNTTTENASLLLMDLKQNPKRYVSFSVF